MTETEFLSSIGLRIKKIRTDKRLTQYDLASRCDFEKASMSRIESGRTNATLLTLYKISKALETPMAQFFSEP